MLASSGSLARSSLCISSFFLVLFLVCLPSTTAAYKEHAGHSSNSWIGAPENLHDGHASDAEFERVMEREEFIKKLLQTMTLKEKVGQMTQVCNW
jgi:hypothetical protein